MCEKRAISSVYLHTVQKVNTFFGEKENGMVVDAKKCHSVIILIECNINRISRQRESTEFSIVLHIIANVSGVPNEFRSRSKG